jgi:hypothetical protein
MKRLTKEAINQGLSARNIELIGDYANAKTKTTFIDHKCGHTWEATPDGLQQGTGCPYCSNRSLVHGVGDNDLRLTIKDPLYIIWKSMLGRCYSPKIKDAQPEYEQASCHPDWYKVSAFVAWASLQDWQGKYLDKDLLVLGNKQYGPDTCVFVTALVNSLAQVSRKRTKDLPRGVHKSGKKFQAEYNKEYLGRYETPEEAHAAYACRRNSELSRVAEMQTDARIQAALLNRRT